MRSRIISLSIILFSTTLMGQIDHWETVVYGDDIWKYHIGNSDPGNNWYATSFNDTSWLSGKGGFGFGDGDDSTNTGNTRSVFVRINFNIIDTSNIEKALLHIDYDDGFVAYLNGVEFDRSNIGTVGVVPSYTEYAYLNHEAVLYTGGIPESFILGKSKLKQLLVPGNNVLAIQVHNVWFSITPDLSCIPYFSLGITDTSSDYRPTPGWFNPPFVFVASNLPIVKINTFGQTILDDPKIPAELGIIYNGLCLKNNITDYPSEFFGDIMIEQRGESSQSFNKKSYLFETVDSLGNDTDVAFLNFPAEEDWILYGPYSDKTFCRNVLTMKIGREMGSYHSRTRMVDVVLNNEYRGVFVLMEKIKRDVNRLDIAKMWPYDTSGIELTGGYIFRIDKGTNNGWYSKYDAPGLPGTKVFFQYVYPKETLIQNKQKQYIESYVDSFENALAAPGFHDQWGHRYNDYIEFRSFFDFFIINEVANNIDGYRLSTYFHKAKNSKSGLLNAGPFWDFNLAYGNANYCDGSSTNKWQYLGCGQEGTFWWERFLEDTLYTRGLRCRWEELRQSTLSTDYLMSFIDSIQITLDSPAIGNYEVYPILGRYVWPNPFPWYSTYGEEVDDMQTWLTNRLAWLDDNIPGVSYNCDDFLPWAKPVDTVVQSINIGSGNKTTLKVMPNPVIDEATIFLHSKGKDQYLELYNVMGKLIYRTSAFRGGMFKLKRNDLPAGVYYIRAYSGKKSIGGAKMVFLHN